MMKHKVLFSAICVLLALSSCMKEIDRNGNGENETKPEIRIDEESMEKGIVRVKLNPESVESMAIQTKGGIATTGLESLDQFAASLGVTRIERTFPHGGEYEGRMRKAGLHLWYDIYFDEVVSVTRAVNDFNGVDIVEIVEASPKITMSSYSKVEAIVPGQLRQPAASAEPMAHPSGFDDPMLPKQWHYYNDGSLSSGIAGADINVVKAWKTTTGNPEVIVCVVDGGIDYTHPDLVQNLWVNTAELNGTEGVDDDGNGYIDDVYGWNFVDNTATIVPHEHGTHVAGTVAAVNNNGIGVAGVAGGDGTPGSGARVMSAQIFVGKRSASNSRTKQAIVYGANNGAVISQNSWGYENLTGRDQTLNQSDKEAIDYFITYAGTDKEGNGTQTGPMKGGIVIFAAGNDNVGGKCMPGAYEKALAVASMAPNYVRAYYSNYGSWVNITAPGGDLRYGTNHAVLSTIPGNAYDFFQGTSMACPHVSGIAALVVSAKGVGQPGFTNDMLWNILVTSVNDITQYNSTYYGLGTGYIDAYKTIAVYSGIPPKPVTDLNVEWGLDSAHVTWSVTDNGGDETAFGYEVVISKTDLTDVDFDNLPGLATKETVFVGPKEVGEEMGIDLQGLDNNTVYHIAVAGIDVLTNRSEPVIVTGSTLVNLPPQFDEQKFKEDMEGEGLYFSYKGRKIAIDFDEYFTDDFGDEISYVIYANPATLLTTTRASRSSFNLVSNAYGHGTLTIEAKDKSGNLNTVVVPVMSRDDSQAVELYPNPVKSTMYVRMGKDVSGTVEVNVYSTTGAKVLSVKPSISPYSPAGVDLSKLSAGNYTVEVRYNGSRHTKSITKI